MSALLFNDIENQFRNAMAPFDLSPPDIVADGQIHRFDAADDKRGKKSAWYVLYDDVCPAGAFGDWKTGVTGSWSSKAITVLSPAEKQQHIERIQQAKALAEAFKENQQVEAAKTCLELWNKAKDATENNPYCQRKGIKPYGLKEFENSRTLLVPIHDDNGQVTSLQFINADGVKKFKGGGRINGCSYSFGDTPTETILICEGFATGASLHQATGQPVAIAFNAGNLMAVTMSFRKKFPNIRIIICADNDRFTETGNTGMINATKAAQAVSGLLATPQFTSDEGHPTDFNDLHQREGLEAVKTAIDSAINIAPAQALPSQPQIEVQEPGWSEPEPLVRSTVAAPYPVDALPMVVRLAVDEVHGFTKAPMAMVVCSALANLSLAAQALHDVQRAETLSGSIGLYFLVLAESGERKTTCDTIFSKAIRDYESKAQNDAKPEIKKFKAEHAAWEANKLGILDAIKLAAKKIDYDPTDHERALIKHEENEPEPPKIPRFIYADFTPEALTYALGKNWPSGGVISSEAGAVFGSHGMGKESQLRTLAILNQLWDATKLTFDRKSESFVVDGARLTMSLQVQESALMEFFNKTGTLARGTGFLARFLFAHPESTQGTRFFSEPPTKTPALANFHAQITRILQTPAPINDQGGLEPAMLTLSPEAKAAWIKFHDEIEAGLCKGGELQDIRDVASKIADNAARLAALFHVVDNGIGPIGLCHFESASRVAAWHLNEALRFFGELALPEELADAAKLNDWLIGYCTKHRVEEVSTRTMSQYAPSKLRHTSKRNTALQELINLGRIVLFKNGKKQGVLINPQLLVA